MQRILTLFALLTSLYLSAQMDTPSGPRYGNEWIENGQTYLKILVANDGMYRLDAATLAAAGLPLDGSNDARLQLHHLGEEVALEVTATGIQFYGERARGELDAHLLDDPADRLLNPRYGMHTDTAAYYLHLAGTQVQRIQAGAVNADVTTPATTIDRTAEIVYSEAQSKYFRRTTSGYSIYFSHYETAEGFGSRRVSDLLSENGSTVTSVELNLPGVSSGTAEVNMRFGLAFGDRHAQEITINGRDVGTISAEDWSVQDLSYDVPVAPGGSIDLQLNGTAGDRDKANLAYLHVRYPAVASFSGDQLRFSLEAGGARTLNFGGLPAAARLYDLTANEVFLPEGTTFTLPATSSGHEYALVSDFLAPASSAQLLLDDVLPAADVDYLVIANRRLSGSGLDAIVAHRESSLGGNHRVHVAYVEDIYDRFGYGLQRHPQSIRNYLDAAIVRAPALNYLFIIGKGREYPDLRTNEQLIDARETFFVPGFGLPSSDNLFSALPGQMTPRLATGRLSAINPGEVAIYARKLREVESQIAQSDQTIEGVDWMKQVLFLGGGQKASEQETIRRNLGYMEEIFEESKWGGNVTSVFRTSSDPIETTRQEAIFSRINEGVSIVNFYGHSSSQGFDFNIDNPDNYKNKDKYAYFISLGCYSGDAFTKERSISERFIFLPDGGAITFAASKGLGYLGALGNYGRRLYDHMGNDLYGAGVGESIRATVADFEGSGNFTIGILAEQFFLNGDPAYRMHPRPGPDLTIDAASVQFSPPTIPAQDTAYTMSLKVINLGTRPEEGNDTVTLDFRQQLPSGEVRELVQRRIAAPAYERDIEVTLPNLGIEAVGINRILVTVDADDEIDELPAAAAEGNNELVIGGEPGAPLNVIANSARTAFPPRYATVGPGFDLVAGTTDPLAPERVYRLQVATRADFLEPLVNTEITAAGGVIRYRPEFSPVDSMTYYWRISPDSSRTPEGNYIWSESSLTYVAAREAEEVGFAIQHPGQFAEGTTDDLAVNPNDPNWDYGRNTNDIQIFNAVYRDRDLPKLVWNGTRFNSFFQWALRSGVQVFVADSLDNTDWLKNDGRFNSVLQRDKIKSYWAFDTQTDAGREGLMTFLDDEVTDGKYVFVYSAQRGDEIDYHTEDWANDSLRLGRSIYNVLEEQGAEQVRLLQELGSVPYTFVYQKGKGKMAEVIAATVNDTTEVLVPILENREQGAYRSEKFGPALSWRTMNITFRGQEIGPGDSCQFRLYGIDRSNREVLLQQGELDVRRTLSFDFDLSEYDAETYPYLATAFDVYDATDRTAPTVKQIYVDYRRAGDVAINPSVALTIPDTLQQGEPARLEVGYENISRVGMDSLLVALTVTDRDNRVNVLTQRRPALPAGATDRVSFELPTDERENTLRLQLTLNPDQDQPEDVLFNNILLANLGVEVDRIAPDMKVYYDGRLIRNGELVSSEPDILIQLRDENEVRRLDDSSAYVIQLTAPDGRSETIAMSDPRVEFVPAAADGDNRAEVYFSPKLIVDGTYELTVQSSDRNGNRAGALEYNQSFEVINEQSISNVLTYPNPFTTQTRFVYTLTGSTPPDVFRIQIMTVSGRVVRDIDLLAHEAIEVGTHRTDFTWDGTDEYGDLLANGVYLYRVITSDGSGDTIKEYDTGTDQYFKNDLGKVVILR